jgi:hypothetical protein
VDWSFESVLRVLLAAYNFMGPIGTALAGVFVLSGIVLISELSHAASHPNWRVLVGSAAVCIAALAGYTWLHRVEADKVRDLIAGSWTLALPTYTCDDAEIYAVEDKLSGESDLVETLGGVPKFYVIDLQRSVSPDAVYVYSMDEPENYRSIKRVGNTLIESYDRSRVLLRKCD